MTARLRGNILTVNGQPRRLGRHETAMLWLLMCRPVVTVEDCQTALWPDPEDMAETWLTVVNVTRCRLRHALAGSGWEIKWGGRSRWSLERTEQQEDQRRVA